MKIAYLANAGSIHFVRWYEYFIKQGHEVYLISGDDSLLNYRIKVEGLRLHYLPEFRGRSQIISFCANIGGIAYILYSLRKLLREIKPDIIHAHQIHPYGFWAALSKFHPFVVTPIGSDVVIHANKYCVYRKMTQFVLKRADLTTGDSLVLEENCRRFGLRGCFELIQNGVDLSKFSRCKKGGDNVIRKKHGIDENAPLVFFARAFTKLYNVEKIIKAIPSVLERIPLCKFIFAHHFGNNGGELEKIVGLLNVGSSVIFTGLISHEDMPLYHRAANICISVPSSDNSPSFVYEAMACGTPTIISDLPWTKYAMKDQYNTFIIKKVTPENIAAAIIQLLGDGLLRTKIIEGGLETVKEYFSYHDNMKRMQDLMERLVGEHGSFK